MMGFRRHDSSRGNEDSFPTGTLGTSPGAGTVPSLQDGAKGVLQVLERLFPA